MLMFPQWPTDVMGEGCRTARWTPSPRFAPYFARPLLLQPQRPQLQPPSQVDSESSGGSSPEREPTEDDAVCGWTGCGARLPGVARLSAHVARTHAHPHHDGLFYCGWRSCMRPHRGFNARYKMLVHVRTHTNERPHSCSHCLKSFSRAENLKIHLRSHSGEKPYACPFEGCGKAYSNSSDRFKHTRTHTVDKPYCCKVPGCDKRYTDPSSLRKHVKTYKHFTPKATDRESSPEATVSSPGSPSNISSPKRIFSYRSPIDISFNTNLNSTITPTMTSFSNLPAIEPINTAAPMNDYSQVTYIRPMMEAPRIPQYEMSYAEYTQMYEHAYRGYYTNGSIPTITPICDEMYSYKSPKYQKTEDMTYTRSVQSPGYSSINVDDTEMPLNLKCSSTDKGPSAFQIVKHIETPLDLSIKS